MIQFNLISNMMGEVMSDDTDQDNKQQNPDEEPPIDNDSSKDELQTSESGETEENASEFEDKTGDSDNTEEKSSNESEQNSPDGEPADDSGNEDVKEESLEEAKESDSDSQSSDDSVEEEPSHDEANLESKDDTDTESEQVLEEKDEPNQTEEDEPNQTEEDATELQDDSESTEQADAPESEPESKLESEPESGASEVETDHIEEEVPTGEDAIADMPSGTVVEESIDETDLPEDMPPPEPLESPEHVISLDSNSHHAPVVVIVALLVALLMVAVAFMAYQSTKNESAVEDTTSQVTEDSSKSGEVVEKIMLNEAQATLKDVTTASSATGTVSAKYYDDNEYELVANFSNLPNITNGEFFEGWLVNQTTKDYLSTGAVEYTSEGQVVNNFTGAQDYQTQGYTFYVLTLEPNDNNRAPAKHILEGTLE